MSCHRDLLIVLFQSDQIYLLDSRGLADGKVVDVEII